MLAAVLLTASTSAGSLLDVVTTNQQFGTLDTATGAFQQIGPGTPEEQTGLVPGPNGSLLSLTFSGNLESINPASGMASVVGATGTDLQILPNDLAEAGGTLYATDLNNDLYSVNAATGAAQLIGPTGMPVVPTTGSFDESLFGVGTQLYATFDAYTIDATTLAITQVVAPELYQIDPSTGIATLVAPTTFQILSSVDANGVFYAFIGTIQSGPAGLFQVSGLSTLDLTNGNTSLLTNVDPAAGGVLGASAIPGPSPVLTPEPASIVLAGIGMAAIAAFRRRRRCL